MATYFIKGQSFDADPNLKLGSGSEGAVFPLPGHDNVCVKLFHEVEAGDQAGLDLAQYRARKIANITTLGLNLPEQFTLPKQPVYTDKSQSTVSGFTMRKIPKGFSKLSELLKSDFRQNNALGLKEIVSFYANIFDDAALIHSQSPVDRPMSIGDLNTGLLLIDGNLNYYWCDTDSWTYSKEFQCVAASVMFCHPELYPYINNDGSPLVSMKPYHDRFALTIMFSMMAIHGAHPFSSGSHPTIVGPQDRATAGMTIFNPEVDYPSYLASPEVLSDELLHSLEQRLTQQTKDALDTGLLRQFVDEVTKCPNCNADYHASRRHCPQCHEKSIVDLGALLELLIRKLFDMPGTLLWAQNIGNRLHLVCRVQDQIQIVLVNNRGAMETISTGMTWKKGRLYRFFGNCFAVCHDPLAEPPVNVEIYRIENCQLMKEDSTKTLSLENGSALMDASNAFFYRIAGNTLMCCQLQGKLWLEETVTQVYRNQSWFTVDRQSDSNREVVFGYNRALKDLTWFLSTGDQNGENFRSHEVTLSPLRSLESQEDFSIYFRPSGVLLVRKTRYRGKDFIRYSIIGLDGLVQTEECLSIKDEGFDAWQNLDGKLFQATSILHVTPDGVVKQNLKSGVYSVMKDTTGIITQTDRLITFDGKVTVVRRDSALTISKKK